MKRLALLLFLMAACVALAGTWSTQQVFQSTGTQDAPFVGYSQSGASAGIFNQDTHFNSPTITISRSGTAGGELASAAIVLVQAGQETTGTSPVLQVGGCTALTGDNWFITWGDGALSLPGGILDNTNKVHGNLSVDPVHRQLVAEDGVTAVLAWTGTQVAVSGGIVINSGMSTGILTAGPSGPLWDGAALGGGGGGGSVSWPLICPGGNVVIGGTGSGTYINSTGALDVLHGLFQVQSGGTTTPISFANGKQIIDTNGSLYILTANTNFNEGIRLYQSSVNGYSTIQMGCPQNGYFYGAFSGQWSVAVAPSHDYYIYYSGGGQSTSDSSLTLNTDYSGSLCANQIWWDGNGNFRANSFLGALAGSNGASVVTVEGDTFYPHTVSGNLVWTTSP